MDENRLIHRKHLPVDDSPKASTQKTQGGKRGKGHPPKDAPAPTSADEGTPPVPTEPTVPTPESPLPSQVPTVTSEESPVVEAPPTPDAPRPSRTEGEMIQLVLSLVRTLQTVLNQLIELSTQKEELPSSQETVELKLGGASVQFESDDQRKVGTFRGVDSITVRFKPLPEQTTEQKSE